jgi:hypothetical protein
MEASAVLTRLKKRWTALTKTKFKLKIKGNKTMKTFFTFNQKIAKLTVTPWGGYGNPLNLPPEEPWQLSLSGSEGFSREDMKQKLAITRLIRERTAE